MKRWLLLGFLTLILAKPAAAVSSALARASDDFTAVAERAGHWVVNVSTSKIVRQYFNDPFFGPLWEIPGADRTARQWSLGSGLIVSQDGQILTNAHVVEGADEVKVTLLSGEEFQAQVVGQDESVDLAVLKIRAREPLPAAVLGDSDLVRVGQWAIAIGNPLGFDHSVTVGVISAKGRDNVLGAEGGVRYQNFLQTDASINQGNSGGPLCNIRGEVIGVNAAIVTPNQGSIGIGFAIPINMAKRAIPDLLKRGRVVLPDLGWFLEDLTPQLARAFHLASSKGVLISDVAKGGPAARAGLKSGDLILSAGGRAVLSTAGWKNLLYQYKPGEAIPLVISRNGQTYQVSLVGVETAAYWHGLQVQQNSRAKADQWGLAVAEGVVITGVARNSSAAEAGLAPKDVVLEINDQSVKNLADWKRITEALPDSQETVVRLVRDRSAAYVALRGE
jgi:Do/DeqQ family serine protease